MNILRSTELIILVFLFSFCQRSGDKGQAGSFENDASTVLSADSVNISYERTGNGDVALVFVHGWSCDKSYWKQQVDQFADDFTVVTIDLAGHGESGLNRQNYTIPGFGEDVKAVVNHLQLDKVILIGHSMGGGVIVDAAGRVPGKVLGLIGVDTFQDFAYEPDKEMVTAFLAPFRENFKSTTQEFVRSMFPEDADSVLVEKIVRDMSSAPPKVALSALENNFLSNPKALIEKLDVPIYSINSKRYPVNVEGNKKINPGFHLNYMSGVGHFIMLEDPETFNKLLRMAVLNILQ